MSDEDASFADGDPARRRLALKADDPAGLEVISALLQDAVGRTSEAAWLPKKRVFALMLSRFRWEDDGDAPQRQRAGFHAENVLAVRSSGFDPDAEQQAFAILSLAWQPGEDGAGVLGITCSGGAAFAIEVEALDITLRDMEAHWHAAARPSHEDET